MQTRTSAAGDFEGKPTGLECEPGCSILSAIYKHTVTIISPSSSRFHSTDGMRLSWLSSGDITARAWMDQQIIMAVI